MPGDVRAALARAEHLIDLRRWDLAVSTLTSIGGESSNNPVILAQLARALTGRHDDADALRAIDAAIHADPEEEWFFRIRSIVLDKLERFDEALTSASEAVRLSLTTAEPHVVLASALFTLGRRDEAEAEAKRALRIDPDSEGAADLLSQIAWSRGDWADARARLSAAIARNPDSARPLLQLASVYGHDGDVAEARKLRLRAARLDPAGGAARAVTRDLAAQAREHLTESVTQDDGGIEPLVSLSQQLLASGQPRLGAWVWTCAARIAADAQKVPHYRQVLISNINEIIEVPVDAALNEGDLPASISPPTRQALLDYIAAADLGGTTFATVEWCWRRLLLAQIGSEQLEGRWRRGELAVRLVEEAVELLDPRRNASDRAFALQRLSLYRTVRGDDGDTQQAVTDGQTALAHARRNMDWLGIARSLINLTNATLMARDAPVIEKTTQAVMYAREALKISNGHGTSVLLHANWKLAMALRAYHLCTWDVSAYDGSVASWSRMVELAAERGDVLNQAEALRNRARMTTDCPHGDFANNIERGLADLREAGRLIDPDVHPRQHALQLLDSAALYAERVVGDKPSNDAQALQLAKAACELRRGDPYVHVYEYGLAKVLLDVIVGDRVANLQQALEIFQDAEMRMLSKSWLPDALLTVRRNLTRTHRLLGVAGSSDDFDVAVEIGKAALVLSAKAGDPREWTLMNAELAGAYADRQRSWSDRRHAIKHFDQALAGFRQEQAPHYWDEISAERAAVRS